MSQYRKDEEARAFNDLLSETDLKMQEVETQRILEKVRGRAGKGKNSKAWGAPNVYDDQVQRSVSRPLMSPTNKAAREAIRSVSAEKRQQVRANAENSSLPPTAMLAPSGLTLAPSSSVPASPGGFNRTTGSSGFGASLTSPLNRPASAMAALQPSTPGGSTGNNLASTANGGASKAKGGPPPQSSRAMVAKLEAEVKHLRETIGVLLEAETTTTAKGSSSSSSGRKSILKKSRPETAPAMRSANADAQENNGNEDGGENAGGEALNSSALSAGVEEVLGEKERAEKRVMALEKAKRRLAATTKALSEETSKPVLGMPSPAAAAAMTTSLRHNAPGSARSATARSRSAAGLHTESKESGGQDEVGFNSLPSPQFADTVRSSASAAAGIVAAAAEHAFRDDIDSEDEKDKRRPVTKPQEFSFMQRLREQKDKLSISARRLEEERRAKERAEEEAKKDGFRAKPVPAAAKLPLFSLLMNKQEERRRQEHEARMAAASSSTQPFTQLMEHEEQMRARRAAARARLELSQQKELAEGRRFKAIPVPATTTAPDGAYMKALKREAERPVRVAASARALAATASLPPRMALAQEAEKRRKIERQASQKAQEAAERRLARFRANSLPDFRNMHASIESSMRDTRKAFAPTVLMPFGFDSEERHAAEKAREEARRREYELATSPSPALRALATSGGIATAVGGKLGMTRSLGAAELEATMRSGFTTGSRRGSKDLSAPPPPAAMTRTVQLRMLEIQRRVRERQEEERLQAIEDEERARRIREATKAIAPIVQRLEAERNPIPLAWQSASAYTSSVAVGDDGMPLNAAALAKKDFERKAKQNLREQKRRVEEAERARPLLMLRSSLDLRREEARKAALISAAKKIGEPSSQAAWQSVVSGALGSTSQSAGGRSTANMDDSSGFIQDDDEGADELFNDEERELLGISRNLKAAGGTQRSFSAR